MKVFLSIFLLLSVSFAQEVNTQDIIQVLQGAIEEVQGTEGGYSMGYNTDFTFQAGDVKEGGNVKFGLEGEGKDSKFESTFTGNSTGKDFNINYKGGSDGAIGGKSYIGGTGVLYEGTVGSNNVEGKAGAKYIGLGQKGQMEYGNEGEVTGEGLDVGYKYGTKVDYNGKKYEGEMAGEYGGDANGNKFGAEFEGVFEGEGKHGSYKSAHKAGIIHTNGVESGIKMKAEGIYDGKSSANQYEGEWGVKNEEDGAEGGSEFKGQVITSGHRYAGDVVGDFAGKNSKGEGEGLFEGKYIGEGTSGEFAYGIEGKQKNSTGSVEVEYKEGIEGNYKGQSSSGVYEVEYKGEKDNSNFAGETKGTFKSTKNGMTGTYSGEVDSDGSNHNYNGTFGPNGVEEENPAFLQ